MLCPELRDEVTQALEHMLRRQALTEQERYVHRSLWAMIEAGADHVGPVRPGYTVPELGDHQKDAHLFWACEEGHAQAVITTEPRLWRGLRAWRGIPILKPTDALKQFGLAPP